MSRRYVHLRELKVDLRRKRAALSHLVATLEEWRTKLMAAFSNVAKLAADKATAAAMAEAARQADADASAEKERAQAAEAAKAQLQKAILDAESSGCAALDALKSSIASVQELIRASPLPTLLEPNTRQTARAARAPHDHASLRGALCLVCATSPSPRSCVRALCLLVRLAWPASTIVLSSRRRVRSERSSRTRQGSKPWPCGRSRCRQKHTHAARHTALSPSSSSRFCAARVSLGRIPLASSQRAAPHTDTTTRRRRAAPHMPRRAHARDAA